MARPTNSTSHRLTRAGSIAVLASLLMMLLPASAFAGAAVDEYSLGPVGGNDSGRDADVQLPVDAGDGGTPQQLGVLGENVTSQSPLAAAGAAAWIGAGVIALCGVATFAWRRTPGREAEG